MVLVADPHLKVFQSPTHSVYGGWDSETVSVFSVSSRRGKHVPFFSCKKSCRKQQKLISGRISPFTVSPTFVKFKNTCKESEKVGFKAQHSENLRSWYRSHHFLANRWVTVEIVAKFIYLGSKITADGDCSHEIKRRLFFGRKVMTDLDSILKSRDITLGLRSV